MAEYKFVAEVYFEAEDMDDALKKLGEHYLKLSRNEVSHLTKVGSTSALGEPEFDDSLRSIVLVDGNVQVGGSVEVSDEG